MTYDNIFYCSLSRGYPKLFYFVWKDGGSYHFITVMFILSVSLTSPLDNYNYNDVDELGNISWANNLRRNASFIDAIFMFQLKSNLTCEKCKNKKYNFESSYVFDLPLSLCKMVSVEVNL